MPRAGIVSEVSEQSCRNLQVTCCHCAAHSYAGIEDETVGSVAVDCAMPSQHIDAQVIRRLFSAMPFERLNTQSRNMPLNNDDPTEHAHCEVIMRTLESDICTWPKNHTAQAKRARLPGVIPQRSPPCLHPGHLT